MSDRLDRMGFFTPLELVGGALKSAFEKTGKEQKGDLWRSRSGSLIEFTQPARVEPIVLMDQRAMALPYASDILQSLASTFTGYYLQAVALSTTINGASVIRELDRLNPRRDPVGTFLGQLDDLNVDTQSYELPREFGQVSLENKENREAVDKATNLSVGKYIEVKIKHDDKEAILPVMVRLIVAGMAPQTLVHTLAVGGGERSLKERWHSWRAGQLEFIRDLVLCQDLLQKHRKDLIDDPSGYYNNAVSRGRKNTLSGALSGNTSVSTASSIFVITDKTRMELESQLGGKLEDFRTREELFKTTYGMIMAVIDPEWEQVTFYHQSIDTPTELSVRDIKSANKGTGPDIMDILKAFQLGQAPSI